VSVSTWARRRGLIDDTDLFRHRLFAENFAAYLRRNPARWRLRRSDSWTPQDLHIARRHVSLVGRIDQQLIADFVALRGAELGIAKNAAARVHELTCYVPTFSHPKRLLLHPVQTMNGAPLPALHRYDDSRVLARDILALLIDAQHPVSADHLPIDELNDPKGAAPLRLQLLLSVLVFNDPHRLWERLRDWVRGRGDDAVAHFHLDGGLVDERLLLAWITKEGDEFARGLGPKLRDELAPAVQAYCASLALLRAQTQEPEAPFYIDPGFREGALAVFPTIDSLLLHGIQDLLKMTVQTASTRQRDNQSKSQRAELILQPSELAKRARAVLDERTTLTKLLRNQVDDYAFRELVRHLDRWVSYSTVTVRPNVPFIIEFDRIEVFRIQEETEARTLDRVKRLFDTKHTYDLPLKDALSVHVNVRSDEPEIEIGRRRVMALRADRKLEPIDEVFGHKFETHRLVQRYSSKRPLEGDEPETATLTGKQVFLETRFVLARNIRTGYTLAALSFLLVAVFVFYVCLRAIRDGSTKGLDQALTTGTLATGLALWLITTQYRVRLIHHKLFLARSALYIAIGVSVASLSGYAVDYALNSFRDSKHCARTRACAPHHPLAPTRGRRATTLP
jgi:hypothetical protein